MTDWNILEKQEKNQLTCNQRPTAIQDHLLVVLENKFDPVFLIWFSIIFYQRRICTEEVEKEEQ